MSFVKRTSDHDLDCNIMRTACRHQPQAAGEHIGATGIRLAPPLVVILTFLLFAGCARNTDILGIVKAGTLPSTTKKIGKAFDDAFPGGTWDAATTGMGEGEMLAEFHSTTTAEALRSKRSSPH